MSKIIAERMQNIRPSGIRRMMHLARQMKDVVSLTSGEPDFDTPEHIKEAAVEALRKGFTHYTSIAGIQELREAIAEKLNKENSIDVDPNSEVRITVGAAGGIYNATQALINPGDVVLIADPDYLAYSECVKLAGGIPASLPRGEESEFSIDTEALQRLITSRTKMIVFSNPNNPTGSVMSKEVLEEVADIAKEKSLLVMVDEVYEKLIYDGCRHYSIASFPGMKELTISIHSFSKTYAMTGWRIGYVAASKEIIKQMGSISLYSVGSPSSVSQMAALAAITGQQKCVEDMVREYNRRRDLLSRELATVRGFKTIKPKGAFYVFPNVKFFDMDDVTFAEKLLLNARVATVPGTTFGTHGKGHLRISFSYGEETLLKGIKRIKEYAETFS